MTIATVIYNYLLLLNKPGYFKKLIEGDLAKWKSIDSNITLIHQLVILALVLLFLDLH